MGGQLDIAPTLIELCAPAGFAYHSLGENLLMPKRRLGLGSGRLVGPDYLAEISDSVVIHPLPDQPPPAAVPDSEALRRLYNAWCGLGWWRIMKGNALPAARSVSSDSARSRERPHAKGPYEDVKLKKLKGRCHCVRASRHSLREYTPVDRRASRPLVPESAS